MTQYKMSWPKDNLYLDCYAHQVQNFRYHWHQDLYELNILLHGKQHFYQGTDVYDLEADDVILINPNIGHASYCDPEGTIAFVLHFSPLILRQFVRKGQSLSITGCLSDAHTRNDEAYKKIRMYAAQIITYLDRNDPYSQFLAKASSEMLIGTLCSAFDASVEETGMETDEETKKIIQTVLAYMEEHYQEKITLEDIAGLTGYNRTYISTLFHQTVGIRFYDYLIRLRLQKAIQDLITTDRSLTEIAIYNGFSDLKSFNTRFKDMLRVLPSEYRSMIDQSKISPEYYEIRSIAYSDPLIKEKMKEYMAI